MNECNCLLFGNGLVRGKKQGRKKLARDLRDGSKTNAFSGNRTRLSSLGEMNHNH